jgi:phosphoglycolate phosphatase
METEIEIIRRRFDAILFDLDGTLVDTAPDLCVALNHTLATIGLAPLQLDEVQSLVGNGARAMLNRGLAKYQTEADLDALFDVFIDYYTDNIAGSSQIFDGLIPVVEKLGDADIQFAVCTNKPESLSRKLLRELGIANHFPVVVGGDSLPVRKPDPEHILATVRQMKSTPDRSLMIGDSANDVIAAKAANIPVIAVTFGYTDVPVRELGADLVIEHFDELLAAVTKLS